MTATLARITVTPVKGTALHHPTEVTLTSTGVRHNRRFHFIDERGLLVNGKQHGALATLRCSYDGESLCIEFPDGRTLSEAVVLTPERLQTNFYSRRLVAGTVVGGGFAEAVSDYLGHSLRLVQVDEDAVGVDVHPVTLISTATMVHLRSTVDAPAEHWADRFRMLLEIDGLQPYEEECWDGREIRVGDAVLTVGARVPRCVITKQDPRTGERNFNTLDALQAHRGGLLLGMYATVRQAGPVRTGDVVSA